MSTDAKPSPSSPIPPASVVHREKGMRIFVWPKVIFLYPTAIVALICWAGMWMNHDRTHDPTRSLKDAMKNIGEEEKAVGGQPADSTGKVSHFKTPHEEVTIVSIAPADSTHKVDRFKTPQNLLAMLFLGMFAFNLLIMALDFPRFTLVAWILAILLFLFIVLWIGSYFEVDLLKPIHAIFSSIYAVANRGFYLMVFVTLFIVFAIIYITRWLDYWEVLPNEILHHHGPLSDLERYPTMNLKFDKEIPDVLEWLMLGSGRLVLHVPNVSKALVLDNVLFITAKEDALKKVMSRLDVRVTTDQEAGEVVT
jgi:hypothetical protein